MLRPRTVSSCGLASTPSMLLVYRESPALTDTPSLSNTCPGVLPGKGVSYDTTSALSHVNDNQFSVHTKAFLPSMSWVLTPAPASTSEVTVLVSSLAAA